MLEKICSNAKSNKTLNLSRLKNDLDSFRDLGNFAAHRILYNTTKQDIDNKKDTIILKVLTFFIDKSKKENRFLYSLLVL